MRNNSRLLAILLAVLLFGAGVGSGLALARVFRPPHHPRWSDPVARADHLADELGLRPDQRAAVEELMKERWDRTRAVLIEIDPQMQAIHDEADAALLDLLDEAQREKYKAIQERRRQRHDRLLGKDGA